MFIGLWGGMVNLECAVERSRGISAEPNQIFGGQIRRGMPHKAETTYHDSKPFTDKEIRDCFSAFFRWDIQ
jgi:hypothetical protein